MCFVQFQNWFVSRIVSSFYHVHLSNNFSASNTFNSKSWLTFYFRHAFHSMLYFMSLSLFLILLYLQFIRSGSILQYQGTRTCFYKQIQVYSLDSFKLFFITIHSTKFSIFSSLQDQSKWRLWVIKSLINKYF